MIISRIFDFISNNLAFPMNSLVIDISTMLVLGLAILVDLFAGCLVSLMILWIEIDIHTTDSV